MMALRGRKKVTERFFDFSFFLLRYRRFGPKNVPKQAAVEHFLDQIAHISAKKRKIKKVLYRTFSYSY